MKLCCAGRSMHFSARHCEACARDSFNVALQRALVWLTGAKFPMTNSYRHCTIPNLWHTELSMLSVSRSMMVGRTTSGPADLFVFNPYSRLHTFSSVINEISINCDKASSTTALGSLPSTTRTPPKCLARALDFCGHRLMSWPPTFSEPILPLN